MTDVSGPTPSPAPAGHLAPSGGDHPVVSLGYGILLALVAAGVPRLEAIRIRAVPPPSEPYE